MLAAYTGGIYTDSGYNAYNLLHDPSYRPQSPTHTSDSAIRNILNPSEEASNPANPSARQAARRQNTSGTSTPKTNSRTRHRSGLTHLQADEDHVAQRKLNIARFGCSWIRPPGVLKTKQAMDDEEAEMREQEILMQRETAAQEARVAQEAVDASAGVLGPDGMPTVGWRMGVNGDATMDQEEVDPEDGERNLDDEVPDANAIGDGSEGDYEDEDDEGEEMQEARDLDDEIPEAGDYEHTDTEIESSELDDSRFSLPQGMPSLDGHQSPRLSGGFLGTPASLGLDSSLIQSSPTAARGQHARSQPQRQRRPRH